MPKSKSYALGVGSQSEDRYKILNDLYSPLTINFIKDSGLKRKMKVLDVGCGIGLGTCELSKIMGANCKVVGIDSSKEQIKIAKKYSDNYNINNVEFYVLSAENISKLDPDFDLVYCRFLLNTIPNPQNVLAQMYKVLKPNGILACEEPHSMNNFFCYPPSNIFDEWYKAFEKLYYTSGKGFTFDFSVGQRLCSWFEDLKIAIKVHRVVQPLLFTPNEKHQLTLQISELAPVLIKTNLFSAKDVAILIENLTKFENDRNIVGFFPNLQISGLK